jgi:two-component system, LytTR family, sensor kinase
MILQRYVQQESSNLFRVSPRIIWISSVFMGVLASLPKILRLKVSLMEVLIDCTIAFLYSLYVWYYILYTLPRFNNKMITTRFFGVRLVNSLLIGVAVMTVLVYAELWILDELKLGSMMLMYQFRGVLINLTIYMFIYLLYQSYSNHLIGLELERTKAEHLRANYELLKQQVEPHFLFNSLNTLKAMVDVMDEHSGEYILKLADLYRFRLENRAADQVTIEQELKVLDAYIYLLKARFEEGIAIRIDLDQRALKWPIPAFTLQLLVENAVKHNVVSLDEPLVIDIYSDENAVIVSNDLQLKKVPEPSTRMGLENIRQRFQQLTGQRIRVESDQSYFKVILPYDEYIGN